MEAERKQGGIKEEAGRELRGSREGTAKEQRRSRAVRVGAVRERRESREKINARAMERQTERGGQRKGMKRG